MQAADRIREFAGVALEIGQRDYRCRRAGFGHGSNNDFARRRPIGARFFLFERAYQRSEVDPHHRIDLVGVILRRRDLGDHHFLRRFGRDLFNALDALAAEQSFEKRFR
ncbi:MAG: hypothetical protein H6892_04825 [Brucellaceae bacterium]|nr:hypothetical protein [Brucellaceae bacterium]